MEKKQGKENIEGKRNMYGIAMTVNAIFFFLLHLTFVGFTNDEIYFIEYRKQFASLMEVIIDRYLTDSSRVLSEAILFFLIDKPFILWQIADTLICVLICHCLCGIFVNDKEDKRNLFCFMLFAIYPYMHMGSAGWICTSLNYIWPLATMLYVSLCVVRRARNEELKGRQTFFAIMAGIFTANCEMSATVLFLMMIPAIFFCVTEKRKKGLEIAECAIGAAGLIFAFTSPGNGERTVMEAANWMPEFFDLTFFDKLRLCAVFVFEHFVMIPDVIFLLFSLLIAFVGWERLEKTEKKVISLLPLGICLIFTGVYFVKDFLIGHKTNYDFVTPSIYLTDAKTAFVQISELAGPFVFIVATVIVLWKVFPDLRRRLSSVWVLGCGFAVRMALMLSPTMFASWHRTLIFLYFAFLTDIYLLACECRKKWQKNLIFALLLAGIAVNLILTVGLQIRKARAFGG